ncbi:MAG: F0F1 ATP synthase subunit A [Eubacterium sp.]|nr:F0F1 ATP synthase subunit A [Eubacterium sp.]
MSKKTRSISIVVFVVAFAAMLAGVFLSPTTAKHESIQETMRDAVLHGSNKISLFGLKEVNPGLISAFTVTAVIFVFALIVRIFVIPRFKMVPGKFQMVLEEAVGLFEGLAKSNSPHRNGFLGAYIFTAGVYIFIGTLFELFGVQAVTTAGHIISLPAPLSDINGAICLGVLSYCIILSGGIVGNGLRGVGQTLKEFSLPISMSFRLFGALLSGALVTELVYYYFNLSIGLPVFVGVMFTLLHALIQAYVLTMLTSLFYGEVSEKHEKKPKVKKNKQETIISEVSAS